MTRSRFLIVHGPTLVYALLIWLLSSISSLPTPDLGFDLQDKVLHAIEFGILGVLLVRSFRHVFGKRRQIVAWSLAAGLLYAGVDELHQGLVPGRECALGDFIADAIGVTLAVILSVFVIKRDFSNSAFFY